MICLRTIEAEIVNASELAISVEVPEDKDVECNPLQRGEAAEGEAQPPPQRLLVALYKQKVVSIGIMVIERD